VEQIVQKQAKKFTQERAADHHRSEPMLRYITTFVGGGGPRFWFSASPQTQQLNYAQVLIEVTDKEFTPEFIKELQPVLTASMPGARMDARLDQLRAISAKVKDILRASPIAERTRNKWSEERAQIALTVDPDPANLAGVTNMNAANSSTAGISGTTVSAGGAKADTNRRAYAHGSARTALQNL
jgi:multidrug efflux pump subunit AcrB